MVTVSFTVRVMVMVSYRSGLLTAELTNKINALLDASSDLVTQLATLQCQI